MFSFGSGVKSPKNNAEKSPAAKSPFKTEKKDENKKGVVPSIKIP